MTNTFGISVLIRTRDSARTLERVILGLGLTKEDELMVVDSGSTDSTLTIARKHDASVVIADGPFNYSKSLNLGFAAAKNPWVLVLSSHAIPIVPQFLEVHRNAVRQFPSDVAVGYAPSTISIKTGATAARDDVHFYSAQDYSAVETFCGNGNAIYRRSIWEKIPFDETIRTAEDKLWLQEWFQQGGRLAFIPAARTLNCNQASWAYMFRKGYSDARARCQKRPDPGCQDYSHMRLYDLGGALKNLLVQKLRGETNLANWARYSAHIFGQFFGSRSRPNNSPGLEMTDHTPPLNSSRVLLAAAGGWHLPHTAKAMSQRNALAGMWISNKNSTGIPPGQCRRCWPLHLALKPCFLGAPQIWTEKAFYALFPLWKAWFQSQSWPKTNVVQAIMGYATEPFDRAEKTGALKVVDCPNSHPASAFGYWQRECDLWCPGEKVPIPQWMFARMNRELERADVILCPSVFVRDTMVTNGIRADKCFVNPFGVDLSIFKKRETVPSTAKFVTVGTICLRKGHQYLFRAFEIVKKQMPEAELICVGDVKTDFRKEWPKWQGGFTHFPRLTHPELAKLLQNCTAFVFPSQEEGFARVISEAMGAGLPILASYESGATTLVQDGVEGIILRSRDPQHIADAMLRVANDRDFCRRMGEAAHKKGAIKNTWQDYGDRLLAEYAKRLNK